MSVARARLKLTRAGERAPTYDKTEVLEELTDL